MSKFLRIDIILRPLKLLSQSSVRYHIPELHFLRGERSEEKYVHHFFSSTETYPNTYFDSERQFSSHFFHLLDDWARRKKDKDWRFDIREKS